MRLASSQGAVPHIRSIALERFELAAPFRERISGAPGFFIMLLEQWAAAPEAPVYEVSTWGRVRRGEFEVASWPNKKGYHLVSLELPDRDRPALRYVHRLVLSAFRGAPRPRQQGNHEDGLKGHNELDNLAWSTPAANVAHAVRLRLERAGQLVLQF
jgi:hypothetical protein